MKSKISIIIAAFAILISFAFIKVNKDVNNSSKQSIEKSSNEPMSAYVMEDEDQWN